MDPPASRARWAVSLLAVLGMLPYLALKLAWLAGSRVGLTDPGFGRGATTPVANGLTLALEVVAAALALALVARWGRRLPPRLLLFPLWVGTGFLTPVLLVVPLQLLLSPAPAAGGAGPIAGWVYAVVYAGFCWQGLFLLTAAVLHVRARWGDRLAAPVTTAARGSDPGLLAALTTALLAGGTVLVRALGPWGEAGARTAVDLALVAALLLGLAGLAGWTGRGLPRWCWVAGWWVGSGATAAWSAYALVLLLVPNELRGDTAVGTGELVSEALRLLAGALALVVGTRLLTAAGDESAAGAGVVSPSAASASPTAGSRPR